MTYKQRMVIQYKNEQRVKALCPEIQNCSGCYIFYKTDENGFKKYYAGQAKSLLTRIVSHFQEFDHIALSLKKYGLYSGDNPHGWQIDYFYCAESELDEKERQTIAYWHIEKGYIPYNKTIGGQNKGKFGLNENKSSKGYYDGVKHGYAKAIKEIQKLEQQRHQTKADGTPSKIALTAQAEFDRILNGESE